MSRIVLIIISALLLQACAGAVVVGAGVAATAASDRRSVGTLIDDQTIELQVLNALSQNEKLWQQSKITVVSLNGRVLLVGQSPEQGLINAATQITSQVDGVSQVLNELRLGKPVSLGVRSNDTWITTKIKTKIYADEQIPPGKIKVITEDGEVFLIGVVTAQEEQLSVDIARHERGVLKVIKVFDKAATQTQ